MTIADSILAQHDHANAIAHTPHKRDPTHSRETPLQKTSEQTRLHTWSSFDDIEEVDHESVFHFEGLVTAC